MENGVQAFLIAGGVLIAIILISLFAISYNNATILPKEQSKEKDINKLAKWNAEWEAYDKKIMYGSEVLTVINKANQANENGKVIEINVFEGNGRNTIAYNRIDKNDLFKCCSKIYSEITGKIIIMNFQKLTE